MKRCSAFWCVLNLVVLSSCSIHPLPEDVAPLKTLDIVNKIRCEAKEALEEKIIEYLSSTEDDFSVEIAENLRNGSLTFEDLNRKKFISRLKPEIFAMIDKYQSSAIAYDFTFNISESNDIGAGLHFNSTIPDGRHVFGFGAEFKRQRQNTRIFKLADTFYDLLINKKFCEGYTRGPNYIYPITGTIGLKEMIDTFIDLNESAKFVASKENVSTMADTLAFTTTITGSLNPTVTLAGVSRLWRLSDASFKVDSTRSDLHQVIVGLSLPVQKGPPKKAATVVAGFLTGPTLSSRKLSETEQDAMAATVQQRVYQFLQFGLLPRVGN